MLVRLHFKGDTDLLLTDCRISYECLNTLKHIGFDDVFRLPPFKLLSEPISAHPDMLIYQLNDSLLIHKEYYETNKMLFEPLRCKITLTSENISELYPHDILLNALKLGDTIYGKLDFISGLILNEASNHINVKQGYAKCSVCKVGEKAAITADKSLANALSSNGIEILLIKSEGIKLRGYNCGFIGGASFTYDDTIAFMGDISLHPDYNEIINFITAQGYRTLSLSHEPLYDYGGIIKAVTTNDK